MPKPDTRLTRKQCRQMAADAQPTQPSNALYRRSAEDMARALFGMAGK